MSRTLSLAVALFLGTCAAVAQQPAQSEEGARVLALDNSWNKALETNDTKALAMLLADNLISIDIDGSIQNRSEFLASLQVTSYEAPSQAVTEQSKVDVYSDSAIVFGVFRTKGTEKGKPYTHRERFLDTWVKINGTWKCAAAVTVLIPSKKSSD